MNDLLIPERELLTDFELSDRQRDLLRYGVSGGAEPHCFGSLQVCRIRVAKLTAGGAPLTGATNGYVSSALVQMTLGVELSEGADLEVKNGCGEICQTFKDCDKIKRLNLGLQLCQLDSILISYMTSGTNIVDLGGTGVGNSIGFEFPGTTDACPNGVSLEVWTKAWDSSQQATPPFLGGSTAAYFHWVFPRTKWQIGDLTFEDDFMAVQLDGFAEENDNLTANGPFDDWPADITARGGFTNVGGWFMDSSIPTASCAAVSVASAAS